MTVKSGGAGRGWTCIGDGLAGVPKTSHEKDWQTPPKPPPWRVQQFPKNCGGQRNQNDKCLYPGVCVKSKQSN